MRAVLHKLRSDFRSNRVQRLFIVLLLTLAIAALTTSITVQARGGTAWEELFRETNGAHAWIYGRPEAVQEVGDRDEITDSTGVLPMTQARQPDTPDPGGRGAPFWLQGSSTEPRKVDHPAVVEGRWLQADGEIVLPRKFATENGYRPGDTIRLETGLGSTELRVVGLAVFAGRSPFSLPPIAWVTTATLTGPLEPQFVGLGVQFPSRSQAGAFRTAVDDQAGDEGIFLIEDWDDVRSQNDEATAVIVTFLGIFSVFALVSAGFVIVNAISGRVLARYRDLGLMKAIGFTPRQLTAGLLIEQVGLALVACLAGIGLAQLLVPLLDDPASREFSTGSYAYFRWDVTLGVLAGSLVLVALATLVPALPAGRIPTVQAIVLGPGRVHSRPSRAASVAHRLRAPAWGIVGMKDAFDRPVRSWLTVGALMLAVVTVTFVVTTEYTLEQLTSRPELIGEPFELAVGSPDGERLEQFIKDDETVERYFPRATTTFTPEGKDEDVTLMAVGPGFENVDWVVSKGRLPNALGEAAVGKGFLDVMDADIGDTVELTVQGKPISLKIVGMYRVTEDGGRWAMTTVETARQVDPALQITSFALALREGADLNAAVERYRQFGVELLENWDHSADGIGAVRAVLLALGAMLLLVGLVSVVNTLSTGIRERHRDLGVLKAVGFTPRQIVASVWSSATALTAVALVAGVPLGVWVSMRISDFMGNQLGWGPGLFERPPLAWLAAIAPAMLLAVLLAAFIPAGSAARLRANEALRSE